MLTQQDVKDQAVDLVVASEQGHRADLLGTLTEPVDATLALFVAGGVPGQVVVDDCLELVLKVDAFRETVGCNEDVVALDSRQFVDPCGSFLGRQGSGDDCNGRVATECLLELLANVFGGVDEPAEDDGLESVGEQLLDDGDELGQLGVLLALEGLGNREELPKQALFLAAGLTDVRPWCGIGGFGGLVVGKVQDYRPPDRVSLLGRVDPSRSRVQRLDGGPRRGCHCSKEREG